MALETLPEIIAKTLEDVKQYVRMDGGDMEVLGIKDKIVYIRLLGNCIGCGLIDVTFKEGIEQMLLEEFPDYVTEVEVVM